MVENWAQSLVLHAEPQFLSGVVGKYKVPNVTQALIGLNSVRARAFGESTKYGAHKCSRHPPSLF